MDSMLRAAMLTKLGFLRKLLGEEKEMTGKKSNPREDKFSGLSLQSNTCIVDEYFVLKSLLAMDLYSNINYIQREARTKKG